MSVFGCRFLGNEAIRETERAVIAVRQFGTARCGQERKPTKQQVGGFGGGYSQ
jgi:hypothetical protein